MVRHLAIVQSLLMTTCAACGKEYEDKIHFRSKEYDKLSKAGKLIQWRGLTVKR
jgi:hypothetical protein